MSKVACTCYSSTSSATKMTQLSRLTFCIALFAVVYIRVNARVVENLTKLDLAPIKIVNGTDAEEGEFPYMVQLRNPTGYFECGGSIIGDKWVLTAGHCVDGTEIYDIVYGTNILYDQIPANTTIQVKHQYLHPQYGFNVTEIGSVPLYDVGILELEEPIPLSNTTKVLKLVDSGADVPFHVNGSLAGWGANETWGDPKPYLQKITLELLTTSECRAKFAMIADVFNGTHNLCDNNYWNGECYGDSGSPFVINGIQYGIVSWSLPPCGIAPGTYSRISNPEYRAFIKNVTGI